MVERFFIDRALAEYDHAVFSSRGPVEAPNISRVFCERYYRLQDRELSNQSTPRDPAVEVELGSLLLFSGSLTIQRYEPPISRK